MNKITTVANQRQLSYLYGKSEIGKITNIKT